MANNGVCAGYCITVLVTSPGGRPISDAKVVCTAKGSSNDVTVLTGKDGTAIIALREEHMGAGSVPGQRGELTLKASKHHHGPVVADTETFKNGPAEVSVVYEPAAKAKLTIPSAATVSPKDEFLWGRPKVDTKGRLQIALVDGGTLGQNYFALPAGAARTVPARRLTPDPRPPNGWVQPTVIAEVDQELIFRMAHGDLALNDATRAHAFYEFQHDMSMGEFDACDPARCKLAKQAMSPVNEPPPDPKDYLDCEKAPIADRINVLGSVLAGVKILHIDFAAKVTPKSRLKREDSLKCSNAFMVDVHPRNVLGMIRLCKQLKKDYSIAAIYTAGFIRWKKKTSFYAWDSHGRGRAVDLSGVAQQMPKLPAKDGATITQPVRPGTDLVIYNHWGLVKLQVQTTRSITGTATTVVERRSDGGADYSTNPQGTQDYLLYRLNPVPDPADRAVEFDAPPVPGESAAEHLARSEDWSHDHYGMCSDVFQTIWEFLNREYSTTDGFLGPIENIDQKVGGSAGQKTPQLLAAERIDKASTAPPIGSVEGRIVHPDYPNGANRATHNNHFHFQFGNSKVKPGGDYER